MDATTVVIALVALVALSTVLGLLHRRLQGRAGHSSAGEIVAIDGLTLGARATLLQFSTEVCAPCVATRRVLAGVAAGIREPRTSTST